MTGSTSNSGKREDTDQTVEKTYALMVEMADRVSQRRQSANSFYLSVNTALVSGSAYLAATAISPELGVLGVAGVTICVLWIRNIVSYKTLNAAKFEVIHELERQLPVQPFTREWELLDPDGTGARHKPFHKTEVLVPV